MNEVFVSSSSGEPVELIKVWDAKTYTSLMSYRGNGTIAEKGVVLLGSDFVIAAQKFKPILNVWSINSQQELHSPRLVCPGKVSVVACSPDGCYIAVGVEEKMHVYQVSSGCLVGTGVRHFQPIKVIRWCCDGSILVCGGEDGMVTVWYLSTLMQQTSSGTPDPHFTFSEHSLPVTDLILTSGGSSCSRSRLISVSCDRTCKIYELNTGKVILSVVFTNMLTSVTISPNEMEIFVGTTSGDINEFSLQNEKNLNSPEVHINTSLISGRNDIINVFSGHTKPVTCLSMSLEGEKLLSGSNDETVRIWHILSKQCLKIITCKGPVTNAFFTRMPKKMLEQEVKRDMVLCPFQKTVDVDDSKEYSIQIVNSVDLDMSNYDIYKDIINGGSNRKGYVMADGDGTSLMSEIDNLRFINEQLYKVSVAQLLQKREDVKVENSENDVTKGGVSFDDICNETRKKRKRSKKMKNIVIDKNVQKYNTQKQPSLLYKKNEKKKTKSSKFY